MYTHYSQYYSHFCNQNVHQDLKAVKTPKHIAVLIHHGGYLVSMMVSY